MEQYYSASQFYQSLDFDNAYSEIKILRLFANEKERLTWIKKSQDHVLQEYLGDVVHNVPEGISAPYGFGKLILGAKLNYTELRDSTESYFYQSSSFLNAQMDKEDILDASQEFNYVIVCSGTAALGSDLFDWLPIVGNKGQSLMVRIPDLSMDSVVKGPVFLMPYKEDLFWVGATYERDYEHSLPTTTGLNYLQQRLERFLETSYEIVEHFAGIRPTVPDRRPLVGKHPQYANIVCFNGMGSRAALMAPWCADRLFDHIVQEKALPRDIDLKRYYPS
jgi:hypothetical protein